MKKGRDIPAAELEILGALWRIKSGTVRDVLADLESRGRKLAYTTVLTLLGRLEERGYVRSMRERQPFVYRPRISRRRVTTDRLGRLVQQLADGEAMPLILQLVQAHRLSARDLKELRELLTQLEREARHRENRNPRGES